MYKIEVCEDCIIIQARQKNFNKFWGQAQATFLEKKIDISSIQERRFKVDEF
jgi:hypothetical protein